MGKLPEKILRIEELTFILPEDFDSSVVDALDILIKYIKDNEVRYLSDDNSTMVSLLANSDNSRLCIKYGIFEKVDECTYKLMDRCI